MEKSRMEILSELQQTLSELKARIAEGEKKLADFEELAEEEATVEAPAAPAVEEPAVTEVPAEVVAEAAAPVEEDLPAPEEDMSPIDISIDIEDFDSGATEPVPAAEPEPAPAPAPKAAAEPAAAPAPKPAPAPNADSLLMDEELAAPKSSINDRQERHVKKAVMDVMGQKLAWKTAIPGTPVKNVISAISLNDRVLFINTLFKEDPMAFQDAIAAFNGMSSFEQAEEYVKANHPEWNLNSDLVFRLMMAVRRKLR